MIFSFLLKIRFYDILKFWFPKKDFLIFTISISMFIIFSNKYPAQLWGKLSKEKGLKILSISIYIYYICWHIDISMYVIDVWTINMFVLSHKYIEHPSWPMKNLSGSPWSPSWWTMIHAASSNINQPTTTRRNWTRRTLWWSAMMWRGTERRMRFRCKSVSFNLSVCLLHCLSVCSWGTAKTTRYSCQNLQFWYHCFFIKQVGKFSYS